MRLSDENLRGRSVIAADGVVVGAISALFIDSAALRIESIQIKLHRDIADRLGAGHTMFHAGAVEVPSGLIQSIGDAVVLSVTVDGLRQVMPAEHVAAAR